MATTPQSKALLQAVNLLMKSDADRLAQRLDEVQLRQVQEAEHLLGSMAGSHVVAAFLQWSRSGLGRGR